MSQCSKTEYFFSACVGCCRCKCVWRVGVSSLLKCYLADFHVGLFISEWEKREKRISASLKWLGLVFVCDCSQVSCPYSEINLNKEGLLPDRLSGERPLALCGPQPRGRRPEQNANATAQSSSTPERQEGAEESQSRFEHRRTLERG